MPDDRELRGTIGYIAATSIDECDEFKNSPGSYALLFVSDGLVFCSINGTKYQFGQGDMIFFRKDDRRSFLRRSGTHVELYAITFDERVCGALRDFFAGDYFKRFTEAEMPPIVKLRGIQRDKTERDLRMLKTASATEGSSFPSLLRLTAAQLIYDCFISRLEMPAWLETPPDWFVEYYLLLSRHYVFTKPFAEIVALSGKSREYISRLFKRATGTNISDYIISQRMGYACNLLKSSNMDVMEISFDCGFENLSTFYHHFTDRIGIPPQKYRSTARGQ